MFPPRLPLHSQRQEMLPLLPHRQIGERIHLTWRRMEWGWQAREGDHTLIWHLGRGTKLRCPRFLTASVGP